MCRLGARNLNALRPTMEANGVNLVVIGLEQFGAEEFVKLNFFEGGTFAHYIIFLVLCMFLA